MRGVHLSIGAIHIHGGGGDAGDMLEQAGETIFDELVSRIFRVDAPAPLSTLEPAPKGPADDLSAFLFGCATAAEQVDRIFGGVLSDGLLPNLREVRERATGDRRHLIDGLLDLADPRQPVAARLENVRPVLALLNHTLRGNCTIDTFIDWLMSGPDDDPEPPDELARRRNHSPA